MTAAPEGTPAPLMHRVWAPVLAGFVIAGLYWPRVDSVFYFIYGGETQGLLLASALADGLGMVDISLPGHPAHVREPPLFYLMVAGLIRAFGLRLFPMKVLMWAGCVASGVLGTLLFQRRGKPWLAFFSMVLCLGLPDIFKFSTGPKVDIPFLAFVLATFLAVESLVSGLGEKSRKKLMLYAAGAAVLIGCAIFMRTLAVALLLAALAAVVVFRGKGATLRSRVGWAAALAAPVVIAIGVWALRSARVPNPAGYTYLDWFLMAYPADSLEMIAIDFHAPLAGDLPRITFFGLMLRGLRHVLFYFHGAMDSVAGTGFLRGIPNLNYLIAFGLFMIFLFGLYKTEKGRVPAALFFLGIYFAVIVFWPMDDLRLLFPLLPFVCFYFGAGLYALLELIGKRVSKIRDEKGDLTLGPRSAALVRGGTAFVLTALIAGNLRFDFQYHRAVSRLPTKSFQPGFEVRFSNRETRDSFELLIWARDHIPPGAVFMYHSPPPCRFFSGHLCQSIPFTDDLKEARDYIVDGGADYLVIDDWGKLFPAGPGWFVENVLRPVVRTYPSDFETMYEIPGTGARVMKVGS